MSKTTKPQETATPMRQLTETEIMNLLAPMQAEVMNQLETGIKNGNFNFIKLYLEYRFGKPGQLTEDNTSDQKQEVHIIIDGNEEEW